jgi:hypothetical protein
VPTLLEGDRHPAPVLHTPDSAPTRPEGPTPPIAPGSKISFSPETAASRLGRPWPPSHQAAGPVSRGPLSAAAIGWWNSPSHRLSVLPSPLEFAVGPPTYPGPCLSRSGPFQLIVAPRKSHTAAADKGLRKSEAPNETQDRQYTK